MKYFSEEEIEKLRETKLILIRKHYVYDITEFYLSHPGGKNSILKNIYNMDNDYHYKFHTKEGKKIWEKYKIGELKTESNCSCF
jgi:cytochrome b involved in lipid metabolism